MNKKNLFAHIIQQIENELPSLKAAAQATYEAATSEESRPENEYDTRALEASYLAVAQAKRVGEMEALLTAFKFIEIKNFAKGTPIGPTALVELQHDGKKINVFLLPNGGGLTVNFEGKSIQILTPKSPLGEALVGLTVGDEAYVEKADESLEYEILTVE